METFKYKAYLAEGEETVEDIQDSLNKLGKEGFEFAGTITVRDSEGRPFAVSVLKRKVDA